VAELQERRLELAGAAVACWDSTGDSRAVLAVPGLPGSSRDFRHLAPLLSASMRVVLMDLPGYRRSPRVGRVGMSTEERSALVADAIDRLDLAPVVLMGHSMGCPPVVQLAATRLDVVSHVVLLAPPGPRVHYPQRAMQAVAPVLRHRVGGRAMTPLVRLVFAMQGFPAYITDDERTFTLLDDAACNFDSYSEALAELTRPTMVAWASDDRLIPSDRFEALARIVPPGPRLVYPSGGHALQKQNADDLAASILHFVHPA
jgi:pimeloyl-ACP methyl ester carboxylesterase